MSSSAALALGSADAGFMSRPPRVPRPDLARRRKAARNTLRRLVRGAIREVEDAIAPSTFAGPVLRNYPY